MYAGQKWFEQAAQYGVNSRRRNPKRKSRLPYHAKKQFSLPVVGRTGKSTCMYALAQHEETVAKDDLFQNGLPAHQYKTVSYALACTINHKHTTKKPTHRDVSGRKWQ